MRKRLKVVQSGPFATVQDLGRSGFGALGVGRSGAADRGAFRLANRLVGNSEGAAAVELTLGGLAVRAQGDLMVALTGAPCPMSIGAANAVTHVPDGAELRIGRPPEGMRSYLAVRGGIDLDPVMGSRSADTMSGIGPPRIGAGDVLDVGSAGIDRPTVDIAPVRSLPAELMLRVIPGPRDDWFESLDPLFAQPYEVTPESDRVGMRLSGPGLVRSRTEELPSEGMVPGALQVPPTGQPVLFLADHPVTGGYPVAGVVVSEDVDLAAQARPGQRVSFRRANSSYS